MSPDALPLVNAILGSVNLMALLTIAFFGGRWMGRVEERLDTLERGRRRNHRPQQPMEGRA